MTGFASSAGANGNLKWTWDLRSVNAKGLDIRLRVPDWIPGLDQAFRGVLQKRLSRGNITLNLRVMSDGEGDSYSIDADAVNSILSAIAAISELAEKKSIALHPVSATEIMAQRGVLQSASEQFDSDEIVKTLTKELTPLIDAFLKMRAEEGDKLAAVLSGQIEEMTRLVAEARKVVITRKSDLETAFKDAITRVIDQTDAVEQGRLEQELALLAVKSDITEELDRLDAHVAAARDLLHQNGPIGRKMDFLMQEFNREANTLCSKSQSTDLTRVGLDLKALIDQMREQVQNVE